MRNTSTKEHGNAMTLVGTTPPSPQNDRAPATWRKEKHQQDFEELQDLQQQSFFMHRQLQRQLQEAAACEGGMGVARSSPTIIASAEPMKVQSSLADSNPMIANPYDDSLQEQLDHLKQLMSVVSLKCNQIQTQVDSSWNLTMDQDVQLPPGLHQPSYL